ncbi:MAG: DUF4065 domain-containing protein [Candidatus Acidulodesulfobacterium acidiphilum]|uniref:DUF4065 domain-containing protein n=1 Tax=Candidatus Acidulodesulfobacterium acidiphilum TaxID=2597224 RepID=A0A520XFD4_9DELT|nr:MAG: DUF4065 domain-containing protein [Candidatus Acidulodesulfobacterium acidiphilum]
MTTASDVAKYFIFKANQVGSFLSNLKLQKLVYYAQAWYLANNDKPLFTEKFEAWVHGPVQPELYRKFKDFRWSPINIEVKKVPASITKDIADFLDEVAEAYFKYDGLELEIMTHNELPWQEARKGISPYEPSNEIISEKTMQIFYSRLLNM